MPKISGLLVAWQDTRSGSQTNIYDRYLNQPSDFSICTTFDPHGGTSEAYICDTSSHTFFLDSALSELGSFYLDSLTHEIKTSDCCGENCTQGYYKYQSRKLEKLRGTNTIWSDSDYTVTYYTVKNGKEIKTHEASYKTLENSDSVEIKEYQYRIGKRILLKTGIYPEEKNYWHD